MKSRDTDGYAGIDIFRVVAAFLVVTIHTFPLADMSETGDFILTGVIARLAVPFFFMTSGFFTVTRYASDMAGLGRFERRTAITYLAAILIYLPVNIRNGYFLGENWPVELARDILFDGTMYHLWYLPAAALGAAIAWYLVRRTDYPAAFAVSAGLYLLGLFGDSWEGAARPVLGWFYDGVFRLMDRTRGGVFMAPLFFVLGAYLRDSRRGPCRTACVFGSLTGLLIMTAEALEVRALGWARYYTMYLSLPVCAFFIFALLLTFGTGRRRWAGAFSLAVYIIHQLVIIAVRGLARPLGLWGPLVENSLGHFLAVCALTTAVAAPAAVLMRRLPRRKGSGTDRAWRTLDIAALGHNVAELRRILPAGCELMAVVKANAYGHGEFETASELERLGVRAWAAATVDEAIALRRYGVHGEILVLGFTDPSRVRELRRYRLTQTVVSRKHAERLNGEGVKIRVHLKIDTGMHRLGIPWDDDEAVAGAFALKNLRISGMFTHLAYSESRDRQAYEFTREQRRRFLSAVQKLEARGIKAPALHMQSTYGALNYPELSSGYIRVGLGIYGVLSAPGESTELTPDLRPVLGLCARVALVRDVPEGEGVGYGGEFRSPGPRRIAILPIGYADGYPRELSGGRGYVLLHGRRAPVAGAVCMDQMAVDVSDIPETSPGDIAVLIGTDGEAGISAPELAALAGTITNELLSRLGPRLPVICRRAPQPPASPHQKMTEAKGAELVN